MVWTVERTDPHQGRHHDDERAKRRIVRILVDVRQQVPDEPGNSGGDRRLRGKQEAGWPKGMACAPTDTASG
jgi:hypothetical protein